MDKKKKQLSLTLRVLLATPYFTLFLLLALIQMKLYNKFMLGEEKGHHVANYDTGIFYDTVTYDRNKKPEKEYITWNQYWTLMRFI